MYLRKFHQGMFFQVKHVSRYGYTQPVFCDPLTVRLRPREDPTQRLLRYRLDFSPEPAGISEQTDLAGNAVTVAWFLEVTLSMTVTTSFVVETLNTNPYNFLLENDAWSLPLRTPEQVAGLHALYLHEDQPSSLVRDFAKELARETDYQTVPFLSTLCSRIYQQTGREIREEGDAWAAEYTLTQRRGSCRDYAVLFNAACRAMGIPARFVSGYCSGESNPDELFLHAWSEVYLPGAGWRGFDASRGFAVADGHVAVAAGRTPADAAPTSGTFRGNGRSSLQTQIALHASHEEPRRAWPAA